MSVIALAIISMTIGFVACNKDKETINENQTQKENPYDSYFTKYSKDVVKSLAKMSNTKIGYEEWSRKVDSIVNSMDMSAFSSEIDELKKMKDSTDKQLLNTFFNNLSTMDAYSSAKIVEKQVYSSNRNQKEKNACLFLVSYIKTIEASLEEAEDLDYLPDGWHDRYLDCMREIHANMNWIQWLGFIAGIPKSFLLEAASCMWDAVQEDIKN